MGPDLINGLPAHVFLVHIVVVLVPLTALSLVLCALWPSVMRRFGLALPLLGLVSLGSVPLTTHAGEWLEGHIDGGPLVAKHAELGDGLLPWVGGLFVMTLAVWLVYRRAGGAGRGDPTAPTGHGHGHARRATSVRTVGIPLRVIAVLLALAVGGGTGWQVYRVGDSGAQAAWHNGFRRG